MNRIRQAPQGLKRASLLILLSVLAVGFELILILRVPFWKVPWKFVGIWMLAALFMSFAWMGWVRMGKRWALPSLSSFAAFWILLSIGISARQGNPQLGFFALGLSLYWILTLVMIKKELSRSYLGPQLTWYQGAPECLPELRGELLSVNGQPATNFFSETNTLGVSSIDSDGVFFVFSNPALYPKQKLKDPFLIRIVFRSESIVCSAHWMSEWKGSHGELLGIGMQFLDQGLDIKSDLLGVIEELRGAGYVV